MEDRAYWVLGDLAVIRVSGEETDGRYCVVEWVTAPGSATPLHAHGASQTIHVIDGEVTIHDREGAHVLGAGDSSHHEAGVAKAERVTSDTPARLLDVNSPAGFDRFLVAIGSPVAGTSSPPADAPDFDRVVAAAREVGLEILGPPGALPSVEVA